MVTVVVTCLHIGRAWANKSHQDKSVGHERGLSPTSRQVNLLTPIAAIAVSDQSSMEGSVAYFSVNGTHSAEIANLVANPAGNCSPFFDRLHHSPPFANSIWMVRPRREFPLSVWGRSNSTPKSVKMAQSYRPDLVRSTRPAPQ